MDIKTILTTRLGKNRIECDKDLFPYLTLRTNVTAQYFYEARSKNDLIEVLQTTRSSGIPFLMIGGGSNLAVTKSTLKGLVIKNSYQHMELQSESELYADVLISSGQTVSLIVKETVEKGWEGFEYHKGLPGTLGGAVFMNSKWTKPWTYVGDNLHEAVLLDNKGELKKVKRDYFKFAYDFSILQKTREIFIEGVFRLKKNDPALLKKRSDEALAYRQKTQPHGVATCGCFFRNISKEDQQRLALPTTSAGYLIDRSGMKNAKIGSFAVSQLHANFIVNTGKREGKAEDLLQLLSDVKTKVREKYGIMLHEEVVII